MSAVLCLLFIVHMYRGNCCSLLQITTFKPVSRQVAIAMLYVYVQAVLRKICLGWGGGDIYDNSYFLEYYLLKQKITLLNKNLKWQLLAIFRY